MSPHRTPADLLAIAEAAYTIADAVPLDGPHDHHESELDGQYVLGPSG